MTAQPIPDTYARYADAVELGARRAAGSSVTEATREHAEAVSRVHESPAQLKASYIRGDHMLGAAMVAARAILHRAIEEDAHYAGELRAALRRCRWVDDPTGYAERQFDVPPPVLGQRWPDLDRQGYGLRIIRGLRSSDPENLRRIGHLMKATSPKDIMTAAGHLLRQFVTNNHDIIKDIDQLATSCRCR